MMSPASAIQRFDSRDEATDALAARIAADLTQAITTRGKASLVVSGGSLAGGLFAALRHKHLDWHKVTATLADERWVEADHPDSNAAAFLQHFSGSGVRFIALKQPAATPAEGLAMAEAALAEIALPFDVTVLGMGPDGHTASLFPHHPSLAEGLHSSHRLLAVADAPKPPPLRISLTAGAIRQSRHLYLHLAGEDKRAVLETAMQPGPVEDLPIRAFLLQTDAPCRIYWAA